jgi:tetratricopeptide (TPR) repeat protein
VTSQFDQHVAAGEAFAAARNWASAERELTAALAINPNDVRALAAMSNCLSKQGKADRARDTVEGIIALAPNDPVGHRMKAVQLLSAKRPRQAVASAREAVRLDPDDAFNHHVLAAAHVNAKAWKPAMEAATRARELAPHWATAMAQQAGVMMEMKGGKGAQPYIDDAIEAGGLESDYVLLQAGSIALARGRLETARDFLGELLSRNPEDRDVLSLYLLTDRKRHGLMRANFQRRYWRREHGALGWMAWGAGWLLVLAILAPIAAVTNVPGIAIGLAYAAYQNMRYSSHRKAVQEHFRQTALKQGY